jgi:DsbC/DsbD-like thiol-disulfide interchange protein
MRTLLSGAAAALVLAHSAAAAPGNTVTTDNVKARLVSEAAGIAPGETITVALELEIRDGWHTYWRNPGDSGQATRLTWTLPPDFKASEIQWPAPHRFDIPPLVNYGYARHAMHLVRIAAPKGIHAGASVALKAKANWLVCADLCIPESGDLALTLPIVAKEGARDKDVAALFASARAELPQQALGRTTARLSG